VKKSKPPLPDHDWDFHECPPEELYPCLLYEYARESEPFKTWFAQSPSQTSVMLGTWDAVPYSLRRDAAEFPSKPWLDIPPNRRASVIESNYRMGETTFERAVVMVEHPVEPDTGFERLMVEIHWNWPDSKILEDFKDFLRRNRPRPESVNYGGAKFFGRGKTPDFRASLKKLGALRLLRLMTASEAENYSQEHAGESLYQNESDWSEAKKSAIEFVNNFNSHVPKTSD